MGLTGVARWLAVTLTLLAAGCGGTHGSEHELLANFFRAARVRDRVVTESLSSVPFEPHLSGSVQDFTISNVEHLDATEIVTVDASMSTPDGLTVARRLVIILEPATRDSAQTSGSRWMITSIRQQDAPA